MPHSLQLVMVLNLQSVSLGYFGGSISLKFLLRSWIKLNVVRKYITKYLHSLYV